MRVRRGVVLVAFGLAFGVSLLAASSAWGSAYKVTADCTVAGETAPCGSGWYTSTVAIRWTWSPNDDGSNPTSGCVPHVYAQDASTTASCTVGGPAGETSVTQPIHVEISTPPSVPPTRPRPERLVQPPRHDRLQRELVLRHRVVHDGPLQRPGHARRHRHRQLHRQCRQDRTATSAPFAYDGTPPALGVSADTGDRTAMVNWRTCDVAPSAKFELMRGLDCTANGRASSTRTQHLVPRPSRQERRPLPVHAESARRGWQRGRAHDRG